MCVRMSLFETSKGGLHSQCNAGWSIPMVVLGLVAHIPQCLLRILRRHYAVTAALLWATVLIPRERVLILPSASRPSLSLHTSLNDPHRFSLFPFLHFTAVQMLNSDPSCSSPRMGARLLWLIEPLTSPDALIASYAAVAYPF